MQTIFNIDKFFIPYEFTLMGFTVISPLKFTKFYFVKNRSLCLRFYGHLRKQNILCKKLNKP